MVELSRDEEIKVAVGVWLCFADQVVQPIETSKIYEVMKADLLPESHLAAMTAVGEWLKRFHQNALAAEQELQKMVQSYDRMPIIKGQILELAEHVCAADGKSHVGEESALAKLKSWLT